MNGVTSAATPIFASIITLINGERLKQGKSSIGFLNPTLYANPNAFTDITEGFNIACNPGQPVSGFNIFLSPETIRSILASDDSTYWTSCTRKRLSYVALLTQHTFADFDHIGFQRNHRLG